MGGAVLVQVRLMLDSGGRSLAFGRRRKVVNRERQERICLNDINARGEFQ